LQKSGAASQYRASIARRAPRPLAMPTASCAHRHRWRLAALGVVHSPDQGDANPTQRISIHAFQF
jgi:hypothetical protein